MSLIFRNLKIEDYKQYSKLDELEIIFEKYVSFLQEVLNDNHLMIVGEKDGELVAVGTLFVQEYLALPVSICPGCRQLGVKTGYIENIFVKPSHQKKRYGEKIVEHLVQIARSKPCFNITLNCSPELEYFYKKNGFKKDSDICMAINIKSACT